jgi:hypothetical protein
VSLLIKHYTTTLCKHVPIIESIVKCKSIHVVRLNINTCRLLVLIKSIIVQAKEHNENDEKLIEAARDTTK